MFLTRYLWGLVLTADHRCYSSRWCNSSRFVRLSCRLCLFQTHKLTALHPHLTAVIMCLPKCNRLFFLFFVVVVFSSTWHPGTLWPLTSTVMRKREEKKNVWLPPHWLSFTVVYCAMRQPRCFVLARGKWTLLTFHSGNACNPIIHTLMCDEYLQPTVHFLLRLLSFDLNWKIQRAIWLVEFMIHFVLSFPFADWPPFANKPVLAWSKQQFNSIQLTVRIMIYWPLIYLYQWCIVPCRTMKDLSTRGRYNLQICAERKQAQISNQVMLWINGGNHHFFHFLGIFLSVVPWEFYFSKCFLAH